MRQNVFILGASGNVGRILLDQIGTKDVPELGVHANPTVVMGLADRTGFAINEGGFLGDALRTAVQSRDAVRRLIASHESGERPMGLASILQTVQRLGYDKDIVFVDATAEGGAMIDFHHTVIADTRAKMVTANKNPLARGDYAMYQALTKDPTRYRYSATTMAGLGAVPWISERRAIGDRVQEMKASLSGTLGFIADQLGTGISLSQAIRTAQERGYTEPDFRDDLNGVDSARKLVILAREAGFPIEFQDVEVERFLPDRYFDHFDDADSCLAAIEVDLNGIMADAYGLARQSGQTLKYLASLVLEGGRPRLKVGLVPVPIDSAFGRLTGTDNRIEVITDVYTQECPWKLEGPGAGLAQTASVVRQDLIKLQPSVHNI